jgi:hypothetical protein
VALLLIASTSPAKASVTLGQLSPNPESVSCSTSAVDFVQPTVTSGNPYVVPGAGTITSWSHNARSGANQTLTMKVFRKLADPSTYIAVGHDGPRPLAAGTLNTFPASIPVKPGDVLGLNRASPNITACFILVPGETYLFSPGNLADGAPPVPFSSASNQRPNISAEFVPSNAFTLGKAKRNKKKGTATLTVDVPNPGQLTGSGKGVKVASAAGAVISKTVTAPGAVKLTVKAKGKQRKTLNETGKVKLKPKITYTPTGGDPNTQSRKLKLKKL